MTTKKLLIWSQLHYFDKKAPNFDKIEQLDNK